MGPTDAPTRETDAGQDSPLPLPSTPPEYHYAREEALAEQVRKLANQLGALAGCVAELRANAIATSRQDQPELAGLKQIEQACDEIKADLRGVYGVGLVPDAE